MTCSSNEILATCYLQSLPLRSLPDVVPIGSLTAFPHLDDVQSEPFWLFRGRR